MASSSVGIACGQNNRLGAAYFGIEKRCRFSRGAPPPCSVVIGNRARSTAWRGRVSMASAAVSTPTTAVRGVVENRMSLEPFGKSDGGGAKGGDAVEAQERLDRWMKESVVEIVKNLKDAPLLVQIFSKKKGDTTSTSTSTRVVVDDWTAVKESWESGEMPMPEGVIFVEELRSDEAEDGRPERERTTRAWGIVVQGKGVGCGPVCYLLKTSRVGSGPGPNMGIFSTHFCLVRVKSFRESAQSQLTNAWLLQTQCQL